MNRPWGIDVSHHQGDIRWRLVKRDGCSFAFMKATEGRSYEDTAFQYNWHESRWYNVGLIRGAYHYAHIENNPVQEATNYVRVVNKAGGFHAGDFAILDIEDVDEASKRISAKATANWARTWLDTVANITKLPKKRILVYTGAWWWVPRTKNSTICTDHPLWLSSYTEKPVQIPGWKDRFWQYTNAREVAGVGKCDANIYNGTLEQLKRQSGIFIPKS